MDISKENAANLVQLTLAPKPPTDLGIATIDNSALSPQPSVVMSDSLKGFVNSIQALKQSIGMLMAQGKSLTEARKQAARERLSMLKQQIESLKQMLAGMDPEAAKAMLAQIKNMSQELRSLAGQLSSSGGGSNNSSSSSDPSTGEVSESSAEQGSLEQNISEGEVDAVAVESVSTEASTETPAESLTAQEDGTQTAADDDNITEEEVFQLLASLSSETSAQIQSLRNSSEKMSKEDADLLGKVRNEFRSLVEMLKQKLQQLKSSEDDQKTLQSVDDDLRAVGDSIDQLMSDGVQASLNASYGAFASFDTP